MALPKTVYVYEETENSGEKYLLASKEPDDQNTGIVGVYDLRETLFVRHKAQFRRPKTKAWFDKP